VARYKVSEILSAVQSLTLQGTSMKRILLLGAAAAAAWYVYQVYVKHNTALPGSFPTLGLGGSMTSGPIPTQVG
jgi:hypothetical protein